MTVHTEHDNGPKEGVEFIHEDDGSITARDLETGVASFGETKAQALSMLAEALALHSGEAGEPLTDDDFRELGINPDEVPDEPEVPSAPWFNDDTDNEP